jgi:hypothetical protein
VLYAAEEESKEAIAIQSKASLQRQSDKITLLKALLQDTFLQAIFSHRLSSHENINKFNLNLDESGVEVEPIQIGLKCGANKNRIKNQSNKSSFF